MLFDESAFEHVRAHYAESPFSRTFNETLAGLLQRAAASVGNRPLRILEIGAGTGGTTRYLLPVDRRRRRLHFTDISPLFLAQAKDQFKSYPRLRVALLDIERNPADQGFEAAAYDIVIASNVVHATADIKKSMQHIGDLLAPSGLFFAIEGLTPETWVNITFGLSEGWWRFTDVARRPSGPLLDAAGWRRLLPEVGFSDIVLVPNNRSDDGASRQAIITAAWPGKRRRWVVLSDGGDLARSLAPALEASGDAVEIIELGEWRAAASLAGHDQATTVVAGRDRRQRWPPGRDHLSWRSRRQASTLASPPDLASREAFVILQAAADPQTARIWFVTRGAQDVLGPEDVIAPEQAGLWGLGRTFSLEHPARWGGVVDLDPATSTSDAVVAVLEATRDGREDQSAWRDGARYVPRLAAAAAPAPRAYPLRSDASYLITGGLGGLGLVVAEWMASRGARHLVLVSRTPVPPPEEWARHRYDERIVTLTRLRDAGVIVDTVAADVSDEVAMTNVMARFGKECPPLGGVVHAAVTPTAAALTEMPPGMFESTFLTKVSSYLLIERLSASQPIAFFVVFSTTTALLGSSGLAHYAAANAVLDALACRRRAEGKPALSVNWGLWDTINVDPKDRERIIRGGLRPMPTAVGLAALEVAPGRWRNAGHRGRCRLAVFCETFMRVVGLSLFSRGSPLATCRRHPLPRGQRTVRRPTSYCSSRTNAEPYSNKWFAAMSRTSSDCRRRSR